MQARQPTEQLSVASRLTAGDVVAARQQGFRPLTVDRPDGEGARQPELDIAIVEPATGQADGPQAIHDGYGSGPLTVEHGEIVLAEFGYGGKRLPSFPCWLTKGTEPSRLAWFPKERMLPPIHRQGMLEGRATLAKPEFQN